MPKKQLELLVMYQDVDLMLRDTEQENSELGFSIEGKDKLCKARDDMAKRLKPNILRTYNRLRSRYKYSIVPVQNNICLGCFAKLPTSYSAIGRNEEKIIKCEQCGRILYWID